ncbi:MAG: DUF4242 domain-containing protein [Luteimonas sp.]
MNIELRTPLLLAALIIPAAGSAEVKAVPAVTAEAAPAIPAPKPGLHRFMVVRTFPPGALDGLDAAGKKQVNATNATKSVNWVHSFANADKTKTFCIYDGPNEAAIRDAAGANKIPVDYIVEIPVVLNPR